MRQYLIIVKAGISKMIVLFSIEVVYEDQEYLNIIDKKTDQREKSSVEWTIVQVEVTMMIKESFYYNVFDRGKRR